MISDAQLDANRANAQQSTGPVTPEGKEASSRNATKHGLTARRLVLRPDQKAEFENLHESLLAAWRPVDAQECSLVLHLAEAQWRFETAQTALDQLVFSAEVGFQAAKPETPDQAASALAVQAHVKDLLLYQRYATGFERTMHRLIASLRQLQTFRMKKDKLESEARKMEQQERDGWENHVDFTIENGYTFTKPEVRRLTSDQREQYLARQEQLKAEREQD